MSFIETFKKIAAKNTEAIPPSNNPNNLPAIDEDYRIVYSPNNQTFRVFNKDKEIFNTYGVSGKPGYTTSEYENIKNTGPLPRGTYYMIPGNYIERNLRNILKFDGDVTGTSWGRGKFQLIPDPATNTMGRSHFTIHNGAAASSAGCIDLANRNLESNDYDKLVYNLHFKRGKPTDPNVIKALAKYKEDNNRSYILNEAKYKLLKNEADNPNSNWDKFFEVTKQFPRDKRVKVIVE